MAFRYQGHARRRAVAASVVALCVVIVWPLLAVPAVAFVAIVYYGHQVAASVVGDQAVPHPSLAFVIVANCLVVLLVQVVVIANGFAHAV